MRSLALGIAVIVVAFAAASANAATRTQLTQNRADRAALEDVRYQVDNGQAMTDADVAYATSFELDPCELMGPRRAECDGTLYYSDGDACDFVYEVRVTRRGRLTGELMIEVCDF